MGKRNLNKIIALATDHDWKQAREAWHRYHDILLHCGSQHGFGIEIAVGVFSSLSPNNDYIGNIRDVHKLLTAAAEGCTLDCFTVSTYGANKRKAWAIAHGTPSLDIIKAPKTRNFYLNTVNPTDAHPVTVDGHIFNCWRGKRIPLNSALIRSNNRDYDSVANAIRKIGAERNELPNVIQGVLWYAWKRIHRILSTPQTEFWSRDYHAAGLGWRKE